MKEENVREAFNFFDREGKGYFTSHDYKAAIGDHDLTFGGVHASFQDVIEEAFPGKKKITYEDFYDFILENCRY